MRAAERGQDRRKRPSKARATEKPSRNALQQTVNSPQETVNGSVSRPARRRAGVEEKNTVNGFLCEVCRRRMKLSHHGERKRFCSPRCRLLRWAVGEIVKDYPAGRASGLRDLIERLKTC